MKNDADKFVIFWGWDQEGHPMFEGIDGLNTTDLDKAMRFDNEKKATSHVDVNYEALPVASIIPLRTAHTIQPKK